jgi:uncharacterized protein YneR
MVAGIGSLTGFNKVTSAQLYEDVMKEREKNPDFEFDKEKAQAFIDKYDKPGNYASEELNLSKAVEGLRTAVANMGMGAIGEKLKDIPKIYTDLHDIWKYSVEDKIKEERASKIKSYLNDNADIPKTAIFKLLNEYGDDGVSSDTFQSGIIYEAPKDSRFSNFTGDMFRSMNEAAYWNDLKDAIVDAIKDDGKITVEELKNLQKTYIEKSVELYFFQNQDLFR